MAIGFLFLGAVAGVSTSANELPKATTGLQLTVGYGQFAYGVFALLAAIGSLRRRPWTTAMLIAWTVCTTYVSSVASFAFHDPGWTQPATAAGVLGAFAGTLAICSLVAWGARVRGTSTGTTVPPAA